jgi:hypothetical protein
MKHTGVTVSPRPGLEGRKGSETDETVAISLTLCSLASAMQTVPLDCEAWHRSTAGRDSPGWRIWWNVPDTKSASARSACLG